MKEWHHGGEIYEGPPVEIDYSVNINPLGFPERVHKLLAASPELITRYPDAECGALRRALSEKYGVKPEQILCGCGASELFLAAVRAAGPKTALVAAPAFSGYERALLSAGITPDLFPLKEEEDFAVTAELLPVLDKGYDMLFLCQPNNPVGDLIPLPLLLRIAEKCAEKNTRLIIDECFLGFTGEEKAYSFIPYLDAFPNVLAVSAFTKLYAMPGLRLGYALSSDTEYLAEMKLMEAEWSVSGPAQAAGLAVLTEDAYVSAAIELIRKERAYLTRLLTSCGYRVFPSTANFILFKGPEGLKERLLRKGILIRSCANYHGLSEEFYRIAVLGHEENERLAAVLSDSARDPSEC